MSRARSKYAKRMAHSTDSSLSVMPSSPERELTDALMELESASDNQNATQVSNKQLRQDIEKLIISIHMPIFRGAAIFVTPKILEFLLDKLIFPFFPFLHNAARQLLTAEEYAIFEKHISYREDLTKAGYNFLDESQLTVEFQIKNWELLQAYNKHFALLDPILSKKGTKVSALADLLKRKFWNNFLVPGGMSAFLLMEIISYYPTKFLRRTFPLGLLPYIAPKKYKKTRSSASNSSSALQSDLLILRSKLQRTDKYVRYQARKGFLIFLLISVLLIVIDKYVPFLKLIGAEKLTYAFIALLLTGSKDLFKYRQECRSDQLFKENKKQIFAMLNYIAREFAQPQWESADQELFSLKIAPIVDNQIKKFLGAASIKKEEFANALHTALKDNGIEVCAWDRNFILIKTTIFIDKDIAKNVLNAVIEQFKKNKPMSLSLTLDDDRNFDQQYVPLSSPYHRQFLTLKSTQEKSSEKVKNPEKPAQQTYPLVISLGEFGMFTMRKKDIKGNIITEEPDPKNQWYEMPAMDGRRGTLFGRIKAKVPNEQRVQFQTALTVGVVPPVGKAGVVQTDERLKGGYKLKIWADARIWQTKPAVVVNSTSNILEEAGQVVKRQLIEFDSYKANNH